MKETETIVTLKHFTRNVESFGHSIHIVPEEYNVALMDLCNNNFIIQEETLESVLLHGINKNKFCNLSVWSFKESLDEVGLHGVTQIEYAALVYQRATDSSQLAVKVNGKYKRLLTDFRIVVYIRRMDSMIMSLKHEDIVFNDRDCWDISIIGVSYYDPPKILLSLFLD